MTNIEQAHLADGSTKTTGTEKYGKYYFCVLTTRREEIYIMADEVRISSGALEFVRIREDHNTLNFVIAPGQWVHCFAASLFTGDPIAVEYWDQVDGSTRSARNKAKDRLTKSLRYDVLKRDGFKCVICGANGGESNLEIDHIHPVSKGGQTVIENLQTLCLDCNRGKRDKS